MASSEVNMLGIDVMKDYLGFEEIRDNKQLRALFKKYAVNKDIDVDPANVPWCAVMINVCERAVGHPGTGKLNARSFTTYGKEILLQDAKQSDIVVFERGSNNFSGHVTYFVEKLSNGKILCIGGNQGDSVCYSSYGTERLITIRRYT